jgi:hypothetical protein
LRFHSICVFLSHRTIITCLQCREKCPVRSLQLEVLQLFSLFLEIFNKFYLAFGLSRGDAGAEDDARSRWELLTEMASISHQAASSSSSSSNAYISPTSDDQALQRAPAINPFVLMQTLFLYFDMGIHAVQIFDIWPFAWSVCLSLSLSLSLPPSFDPLSLSLLHLFPFHCVFLHVAFSFVYIFLDRCTDC